MQVDIIRHTSSEHINAILNHPEVYEYVKGAAEGPLDISPAIADSDNVYALLGEHGGQVYQRVQPGLFNVHSQFKPEGRGKWAMEATRKSLHWMFTRTEAVEIMTICPHGNAPAKALAQAVGGVYEFTRQNGWVIGGKFVPADIYSLKVQDWMRLAPNLVERGQWFHRRLEEEFERLGMKDVAHADDAVHDRYVGAACDMLFGGQPIKGAVLYNRWAYFAGYQPIQVLHLNPLTVDIQTGVLVMRGDDFKLIPSDEKPLH